jgi:predicted anti-sigma-YlaC factor YlaD
MSRLPRFWHLRNLPCEGMARLLSESLDRDLSRLERFALKSHLLYCAACRRYARHLKLLRAALGRLGPRLQTDDPLPGPSLPDAVKERIKQALKSE